MATRAAAIASHSEAPLGRHHAPPMLASFVL